MKNLIDFQPFRLIVLSINTRYPVYHLLYDSSYNIELKYVRSNSEDSDLVRYMTVSNLVHSCFDYCSDISTYEGRFLCS